MFGQTFESILNPAEIAELEGIVRELAVTSSHTEAWCVQAIKHLVLAGYDMQAIRNAVPTLLNCWCADKIIFGGVI